MLNRRILRVKAMQALYSYFLTQESLKRVIQEQLESHYYPDPAKDDFTEADMFAAKRKTAGRLYLENLDNKKLVFVNDEEQELIDNVQQHIDKYYSELSNEQSRIEKSMLRDIEELEKQYLKLISLIVEISHMDRLERDKKERAHITKASSWRHHFIDNPLIEDLTRFEVFNKLTIEKKISWQNEIDQVRLWYRDILLKDEYLQEYQKIETPSAEQHKQAVVYFYKKLVFKNESFSDHLSTIDLYWTENQAILKSLVVKTFQDYEPGLEEPFHLKDVSRNADEDLDFFKRLFKQTLQKELELDQIIAKRTKNWDISRVALTDRIILRMSLAEMMTFPSIPIKVTINEFIEISKNYSTPKSKQFINGILDVIANELTSEGIIRKSGRGLIDNK